jgi:hypothetical protein
MPSEESEWACICVLGILDLTLPSIFLFDKGNNKITELRTILQGKVNTHKYINRKIRQQPEN